MEMRIGGRDHPAVTGDWIPVLNPATGEEVGRVPRGNGEDVRQAVEVADEAQKGFCGLRMRERGKILASAAARIREEHRSLAPLLTREQGKPLQESMDELRGLANILEFYAGLASTSLDVSIDLGPSGTCSVVHEPLGVCGAIIPWNMPVFIAGWKIAPALLTGNSVVIKPSSTAPLTVLSVARILDEAGLPPGVLNVVTGDGPSVGIPLVADPRVRKISFTGSTETGREVLSAAGEHPRHITLELGGSDPMVVWEDAPLEATIEGAIRGRFHNAGQTCTSVKRLFLHQNIADRFIRGLQARTERLRVGNGLEDGVNMGPMHTDEQRRHLRELLDRALEREGTRLLCGGTVPTGEIFARGHFFLPTLVSGVETGSPLLTEEVFGPVLPIQTFPDLDAALTGANDSPFGLGASIWTRDMQIARSFFRQVRAGIVWVNRHLTVPPEIPFGGMKESGIGRENGVQALYQYTQTRSYWTGP